MLELIADIEGQRINDGQVDESDDMDEQWDEPNPDGEPNSDS